MSQTFRCFRRVFILIAAALLSSRSSFAHLPFESSTRAIVHETTVELALTVGRDGGLALLAGAPPEAMRIRDVGPSYELPSEYAARFFEVTGDGATLSPNKIQVRTDGVEFDLVLEYPRPPGNALSLRAVYLKRLPSAYNSAFVMTDELGNISASKILSQTQEAISLSLPAASSEMTAIGAGNSPSNSPTAPRPANLPANFIAAVGSNEDAASTNVQLGFGDFLKLGVKHILTGYDHLLFLGGLLVVGRRLAPMLVIITFFTVAHSITLALAAMNWVQISPRLTEPLIAATIVFVGLENFRKRVDLKSRGGLALGFGLIHGFGFATALRETGLGGKGAALAKPLFAFNLGVEAGQLAVAAVFLPVLFALRKHAWFAHWGPQIISAVIVGFGGFWLGQRLFF